MPDGQPRPTTLWEWFTFACIFGACFFMLALLRGVFLVAASAIQEQQNKARLDAILARREMKASLQQAGSKPLLEPSKKARAPSKQASGTKVQQPTKQASRKSKAAKKAD
jgi:hypothetical protein|eukprot:COSAG06_NODE_359_length_16838_cov_15.682359_3_plen_110_part_00